MKRFWLFWTMLVSLAGTIVSFIATRQYISVKILGRESNSFCNLSQTVNCDQVYATSHADLFGQPASLWGLLFFLWLVALSLMALRQEESSSSKTALFGTCFSFGGLIFCLYKAYVSFFVLEVVCLLCVATYILTFLGFVGWIGFLGFNWKPWNFVKQPSAWIKPLLFTLFFMGAGLAVGIPQVQKRIPKLDLQGLSVKELMQFHFSQSEYHFEIDERAPVWGNPSAKVTLVVFSDFQCPFCRRAAMHLQPMLYEFRDRIKLVFYHYPLDPSCNDQVRMKGHDKACLSAFAARCAQEHGDFWGFHDDIFKNQEDLSLERFTELAVKRGWPKQYMQHCIDDPVTADIVKAQITAANKIYITGTPTLLINNRRLTNWLHPGLLRAVIEEELKRSR